MLLFFVRPMPLTDKELEASLEAVGRVLGRLLEVHEAFVGGCCGLQEHRTQLVARKGDDVPAWKQNTLQRHWKRNKLPSRIERDASGSG
jgi:hypothetical protein